MATVRLAIGPSSVISAPRADRVVLDWYLSVDHGDGGSAAQSDGYVIAREGVPTTKDGWLHHLRAAYSRHARAPRCPVVDPDRRFVSGSTSRKGWTSLRWADATIKPAGYDYRSGAVLTWEV